MQSRQPLSAWAQGLDQANLAAAAENLPEVLQRQGRVEEARAQYRMVRAERLPSLSLLGAVGAGLTLGAPGGMLEGSLIHLVAWHG